MADITAVDKFFGIEPDDWMEIRYGDILLLDGDMVVENLDTGSEIPVKVAATNPGTDEILIRLLYQEIVLTATTTPGVVDPRTLVRSSDRINITAARYALPTDMLEITPGGDRYPTHGAITITVTDQNATPGIYSGLTPLCRQTPPELQAVELPGMLVWLKSTEGEPTQGDIAGGFVIRHGPPEVA